MISALLAGIKQDWQRTFAVEYVRLGNAKLAYRVARERHYMKPIKDEYKAVQRLLKNKKIMAYVEACVVEMREQSTIDGIKTYSESLVQLSKMADIAFAMAETGDVRAMNAFARLHAVMHGMKEKPSVDEFAKLSRDEMVQLFEAEQNRIIEGSTS